jgi:signal transduction histidine kinase
MRFTEPTSSRKSGLFTLAALSAVVTAIFAWLRRQRRDLQVRVPKQQLASLRHSEQALRESESRMAALLEKAPAMIAVVRGPDHVFELANAGYRRLVGGRDVIGKPVAEAVPELRNQGVIEMLDTVLQTREPYVGTEVPVRYIPANDADRVGEITEDGLEEHFINFVYQPIIDRDGSAVGVFAHGVDVTTQVRARAEVNAARDAAEAASNAKSQFLAVMSHELRTPLNAVLGYTELMELGIAGPVTNDQLEFHGRVRGSSQHLLNLINELLDLSKIEAGHMDVSPSPVPAAAAIESAIELVDPQAAARMVTMTVRATDAPIAYALGDESRMRQILLNLLSNAVKFTEIGGEVIVETGEADTAPIVAATSTAPRDASPVDQAEPGSWVFIRVIDTGPGIPAEMLDPIFQPVVQVAGAADSVDRRSQGGTGLGLAISRRLARLMNGDVTVESTVGEGSTFTLWLPAAATPSSVTDVWAVRAEMGRVLGASVNEIIASLASRVRYDPEIPLAQFMSQAELEDHLAGYLADFAQQLVILDDRSVVERASLVRDGIEIRRLVAERHGAQRGRFGWSENALNRELDLLQSETEAAARRGLRHLTISEIEDVTGLVRVFLRESRGAALDGHRRALSANHEVGAVGLDGAIGAP